MSRIWWRSTPRPRSATALGGIKKLHRVSPRGLGGAARLLFARRAVQTRGWVAGSHAATSDQWFANVSGCSEGAAREALATADRVAALPGFGPVPVSHARRVLSHGLLELVLHDGTDVRAVVTKTRHVPEALKVAIEERDADAA